MPRTTERMARIGKVRAIAAAEKARAGMVADIAAFVPGPGTIGKEFSATPSQRLIVCALVGCDVTEEAIAAYLRIDDTTMRKHFSHELRFGADRFEANLAATMAAKALQGNMTACQYLLDNKFGWHKKMKNGSGGITIDQLSPDAQAQIITDLRASLVAVSSGGASSKPKPANLVAITRAAD